MLTSSVRVIGKEIVDARLLAIAPRILATNRRLVGVMLEAVKAEVVSVTPQGPGHFGYHGRDTVHAEIKSEGVRTKGKLMAAVQLYWREYGTRGYFRKGSAAQRSARQFMASIGGTGMGERAFMPANKALNAFRRFIRFYYGANWWNT